MPKRTTRTATRVLAPPVQLPKGHFPDDIHERFEIHEWRHASAILRHDFPEEWGHLLEMLRAFRLQKSWIVKGGGNKSDLSRWVDRFLGARGWIEKQFDTAVVVDAVEARSPTHKVDCYRNRVALELEWNNKDPFFRSRPQQLQTFVRFARNQHRDHSHPL